MPLTHCPARVAAAPLPSFATQLPLVASHALPTAQSLSTEHLVTQPVTPQPYGAHATAVPLAAQVPLPLHDELGA
jgi:hypothetical protein